MVIILKISSSKNIIGIMHTPNIPEEEKIGWKAHILTLIDTKKKKPMIL